MNKKYTGFHWVFSYPQDSHKTIYFKHNDLHIGTLGLSQPDEREGHGLTLFGGIAGFEDCTGGFKARKDFRVTLFAMKWKPSYKCNVFRRITYAFVQYFHYKVDTRYKRSASFNLVRFLKDAINPQK